MALALPADPVADTEGTVKVKPTLTVTEPTDDRADAPETVSALTLNPSAANAPESKVPVVSTARALPVELAALTPVKNAPDSASNALESNAILKAAATV
jgi:hypothetical protein